MKELLQEMKTKLQKLPKCERIEIAKRYLKRLENLLNE